MYRPGIFTKSTVYYTSCASRNTALCLKNTLKISTAFEFGKISNILPVAMIAEKYMKLTWQNFIPLALVILYQYPGIYPQGDP